MIVQVCIGSSCHLKGSYDIVNRLTELIEKNNLKNDVTIAGSFCIGKCSRTGVTIQVDDDVYTGVTIEKFNDFFEKNILSKLK